MMQKYIQLGKKMFPLCRSLTGKGTLETLKILKLELKNLKIKKVKSGTKVFDWKVPDEWNISEAYILDKYNKKIIDFKINNLHVVNYSHPVNLTLKKNQLLKKIYSIPELPKAIPYVASYYKKNWGFCENYLNKKKIKKKYYNSDKFKVIIDSKFNREGCLNYGELLLKGQSKKEILISTYVCHPSMANNELSGPLVSVAIAKYFTKKKLNYSIRFLFIPETIGSIAYIFKNLRNMKRNIIGGYVLTCIGDDRRYSYLPSKYNNSISDLAVYEAFKELKIKYKKYSFLKRGSDERQYNSPGVDLPIGSIMRSKYGTYPEYHTSLDDFKLVTSKGLLGGYRVVKLAIKKLMKLTEKNLEKEINSGYPLSKILCEPHLSKRKLTSDISNLSGTDNKKFLRTDLLNFLQYADGSNSIKQISVYIKLSIVKTLRIRKICKTHRLIF